MKTLPLLAVILVISTVINCAIVMPHQEITYGGPIHGYDRTCLLQTIHGHIDPYVLHFCAPRGMAITIVKVRNMQQTPIDVDILHGHPVSREVGLRVHTRLSFPNFRVHIFCRPIRMAENEGSVDTVFNRSKNCVKLIAVKNEE